MAKQGKAAGSNGRERFEANYEHVPATRAFAPVTVPFVGGFDENPEAAVIEAVREAFKSAGGKIREGYKLIIHLRPVPSGDSLPASKAPAHPKRKGPGGGKPRKSKGVSKP